MTVGFGEPRAHAGREPLRTVGQEAMTGSSNLTGPGLGGQGELNAHMRKMAGTRYFVAWFDARWLRVVRPMTAPCGGHSPAWPVAAL